MAKWQDHRCFSNVEHEQHDVAHTDLNGRDCPAGFTCRGVGRSVTHSLYFVVVTATTVGYGDVTPHTPAGMVVAIILICCNIAFLTSLASVVAEWLQNKAQAKALAKRSFPFSHLAQA